MSAVITIPQPTFQSAKQAALYRLMGSDPERMNTVDDSTFAGTKVQIAALCDELAAGGTLESFARKHPEVTADAARETVSLLYEVAGAQLPADRVGNLSRYADRDPARCGGALCLKDTRVPVALLFNYLAVGETLDYFKYCYGLEHSLAPDGVIAALYHGACDVGRPQQTHKERHAAQHTVR